MVSLKLEHTASLNFKRFKLTAIGGVVSLDIIVDEAYHEGLLQELKAMVEVLEPSTHKDGETE